MDDRELNHLLRRWDAPGAPAHLRPPTRPARSAWWRWFVTGTIRVPVPVGLALVGLVISVWMYSAAPHEPVVDTQPSANPVVSLADFQPVEEVELRVVGGAK
jgi:hypothetical protein